jgi:hypothetical protein
MLMQAGFRCARGIDASGKSTAYRHHRKIVEPVAETRLRTFLIQ